MAKDKEKIENNTNVESRRFPRLDIPVDIEYGIFKKESSQEGKAVTKNISAGGICLIVYEKIEIDTILDIRSNLKDINYIIKARGKVVWNSYFTTMSDNIAHYDLGIEFVEIKDEDRQKLSQYVLNLKFGAEFGEHDELPRNIPEYRRTNREIL